MRRTRISDDEAFSWLRHRMATTVAIPSVVSRMRPSAPVAIVTGASRGAGQSIAIALGSHGRTVDVTGRSEKVGGCVLARHDPCDGRGR